MNYFFSLIWFIISALFCIGLISPKFISKIFKKEFTRKKVFFVFGGLGFICCILIAYTSPRSDISSTKSQPKTVENNVKPTNSPKATDTSKPTNIPIPEKSIQDKLKDIADKFVNKSGSYEIEYDSKDGTASLIYSKDEFYTGETVVKTGYTYLIKFGNESFNLSEVKAVLVSVKTKFTDQYGNSKLEPGVSVEMTKDQFQKFNWEGLKYQSLYDTFKQSAEFHYIHPALLKAIDTSKLYYSESL